ncbi:Ger(x)C family spore germination protein [Alicyclobacillus sp. SO9]|uniref:Ger(x)C family spore germination protein n=1 Tax=Alicyclobacillus sp. SO9 TaxID=2665646 RepID=UPI0018E74B4F|nr:Ger(x)C family spore germination protein [Alicyclobacillus sp. SO9]QQE80693.1 Ger(x)C family spore germination protein [Alicyclobacillus sp. SO9]
MHQLAKWIVIGFVALSSLMTTGCYDRQELEQQAFVTVMGIDKAPNNMVDCSLQIAVPKTPGSGGGSSSGSPLSAAAPLTFRAHSITEALMMANTSVERSITLSHLSTVIFGRSLAEGGLQSVIQPFVRYREFRRTMFVAVAQGTAQEVMASNKPVLEHSSSRMADSIYVMGGRVGLFPVTQLNDLITAMETPHQDVILPLYAVNQSIKDNPKGGAIKSGEVFQPGSEARSGGNPVEWIGGALFKGDKMKDTLSGTDMIYLRMLRGTVKTTNIDFQINKQREGAVGIYIRKERSPDIKVVLSNPVKVKVTLAFDADLVSEPATKQASVISREDKIKRLIEKKLEEHIKEVLKKVYNQDKLDPIPLSNHIRGHFRTYHQFVSYDWTNKLKTLQPDVSVKLSIRRFGKRLEPVTER